MVHCFTSATFAYLDRARVLGETLKTHHPDWTFWLCLSDEEPPGFEFAPETEPFDHIVRVTELDIPDFRRWLFCHDVVEVCTAVKGLMLHKLLTLGADKVVYLDPDIALFNTLFLVEELLETSNILLTPHQVSPDDNLAAIVDNEIGSLKHGIYNLGFIAVANRAEGLRFARWWRDRLLVFCYDDIPNGLFTDQRWCDHVPVFFDGVAIIRDEGFNVASWNLSQRPISIADDGVIMAGKAALRFFHFTKVTWVGELMLERYANERVEVFELIAWYRRRLAAHTVFRLPPHWWAFGCYENGTTISRQHRLIYRTQTDLQQKYPNPSLAGPSIFSQFLTSESQFPTSPTKHTSISELIQTIGQVLRASEVDGSETEMRQQLYALVHLFQHLNAKQQARLADWAYKMAIKQNG